MIRKIHVLPIAALLLALSVRPAPAAAPAPANPQFAQVAEKLDEGGNFYIYANVKGVLKETMDGLKSLFVTPSSDPMVGVVMDKVDQALQLFGLYDIEDFGASSVKKGKFNRVVTFLSVPKQKQGLLKILGGTPHPCQTVKFAPAQTVAFFSSDLDVPFAYQLLRDGLGQIGGPQILAQFDAAAAELETTLAAQVGTEIKIQPLVESLDGEFTVLADIDPVNKINVPEMPGGPMTFPAPRVAVLIRVKNDLLFQTISKALTANQIAQAAPAQDGLQKITIAVPPNPYYPLAPVLATDGQYLFLASSGPFLDQIIKTSRGEGESLADQEEFKEMTQGLPAEGNELMFLSKRYMEEGKKVMETVQEAMAKNFKMGGAEAIAQLTMQSQLALMTGMHNFDSDTGIARVRVNDPDGILIVTNTPQNVGANNTMLLPVAVAGIGAAVAVPYFLMARTDSRISRVKSDMRSMANEIEAYKTNACRKNLEKLQGAKDTWAIDGEKKAGDTPLESELIGATLYLKRKPVCPNGGTYTIGKVGEDATCSCGTKIL